MTINAIMIDCLFIFEWKKKNCFNKINKSYFENNTKNYEIQNHSLFCYHLFDGCVALCIKMKHFRIMESIKQSDGHLISINKGCKAEWTNILSHSRERALRVTGCIILIYTPMCIQHMNVNHCLLDASTFKFQFNVYIGHWGPFANLNAMSFQSKSAQRHIWITILHKQYLFLIELTGIAFIHNAY